MAVITAVVIAAAIALVSVTFALVIKKNAMRTSQHLAFVNSDHQPPNTDHPPPTTDLRGLAVYRHEIRNANPKMTMVILLLTNSTVARHRSIRRPGDATQVNST
jgi:hypothetical protein